MRKTLLIVALSLSLNPVLGQDSMEKVMERRAREMHRVIGLDNPDQWKKFIKENYTKALINKPMQAKIEGGTSGSDSGTTSSTFDGNIEAKAGMYQMLHNDFGGGTIKSITTSAENLDMRITADGMTGTFSLRFSKDSPYLIDGLGIEVGDIRR